MIYGKRYGCIDLGAEAMFAADRDTQQIAVEIKSFIGLLVVNDLADAVGQYLMYQSWLARSDPTRLRYLAVDRNAASEVFSDISAHVLIEDYKLRLIIVDVETERIVEWIIPPPTDG
ncbi:MAG: element excision factor XisH family protein [Thermomicrobiales bacterium]